MPECDDCLGRTPVVSIIGTITLCLGAGLFCGASFRALDIYTRGIFEGLFWFRVPWLETMQIVLVIVGAAMCFYSIVLLIFGILATGATRQKIYSGAKCIMGGRVAAVFFIIMTYFLNMCWFIILGLCAFAVLIWIMLSSICINEYQNRDIWYFQYNCLNLSRFGIYRNFTEGVDKNALCDETEISEFCQHVQDAGIMSSVAFSGCFLAILGMVIFLMATTSNYQRIKTAKELTQYRQAADLEVTDFTLMDHSHSRHKIY